ncbi:NAD(P)H pyrophosphatase NUDT13, mitochondrial isoform X3 [Bombina bombina]|uniref:NAD(P)H pyrophosphatase NUDT13, mitochondrial isoform X3 n=1 Tax=Bombina bombina TaxID=8345 RepID=UPI00235A5EA0|nr:NAD(P)H pyrophosphatase NUDT13, mitochondrial isoform X3 [Bombina bombina]
MIQVHPEKQRLRAVCQALKMLGRVARRPVTSLCIRHYSSYVRHTRFLFELKENDEACRQALRSGSFYVFHNLSPFLRKSDGCYSAPTVNASGSLEKSNLEEELAGTFTDLRKAFLQLRGMGTPCLSQAQALLRWHDTHQYCSKTGKPTQKNVSGSKRVCSANGTIYYPQMSPVVITLVSHRDRCLLARQPGFPPGMYTALAGFCDIGETLEETVRREVAEEVGLEVDSLRYSGSQHWPFPNSSLMVACHAAVMRDEINVNSVELEAARWFTLEEVEEALQRDHRAINKSDGTIPVWVPPKWAIAHHLIREWVQEQRASLSGATT